MRKLKDRIAIVTGVSRQQGIGTAICRALAKEGANIFFTHWQDYDQMQEYGADSDWPERLLKELQQYGVQSASYSVDLSVVNVQEMMNQIEASMGTPAILVNNAYYDRKDGFRNLDEKLLNAHYDVNLKGTLLLSVEFASHF